MPNPSFIKTPVQDVLDQFDRRNFSKVREFLNNQIVEGTNDGNNFYQGPVETPNADAAFPYLHFTVNNPVIAGLKSLEMITKVIAGVSFSGITLFEAPILASSPKEMKTATAEEARAIVLSNLGMTFYIPNATLKSPEEVEALNELADIIAKRVKSGMFKYTDFSGITILRCRAVVKASISYKKVI